jgi:Flp pilus assembly protein TadB
MSVNLDQLTAPAMIVALLVVVALIVIVVDRAQANSPKARLHARLDALMNRFASTDTTVNTRIEHQRIFRQRPRGVIAGLRQRLANLSVNVGGKKQLSILLVVTAVAGLGGAFLSARILGLPPAIDALIGLGVAVVVFRMLRGEMQRRWMIRFLDQLVEAVELLGRSVRSGYSAPAAIRMVGKEIGEPVGPIFTQISDEDDLGIDLRLALRSAAGRVGLPDFTFLIVALVMQRETGGQIAESLDNLHFVLRKRREARIKIKALTAEGRMSANVVAAIPFATAGMLWMMNPDQFTPMFEPGLGQTMMLIAGGLLTTGILVTRWMVNARP